MFKGRTDEEDQWVGQRVKVRCSKRSRVLEGKELKSPQKRGSESSVELGALETASP